MLIGMPSSKVLRQKGLKLVIEVRPHVLSQKKKMVLPVVSILGVWFDGFGIILIGI